MQVVDVGEIYLNASVKKKAPAVDPADNREEPAPPEKPLPPVPEHNDVLPKAAQEIGPGCILKNIVVRNIEGGVEVELILDSDCWPRVFRLSAPGRIIIDIPHIEFIEASRLIAVNGRGLRSVCSGLLNSTTARVVIDLDGGVPDFKLEKTPTGLRVIIPNSLK